MNLVAIQCPQCGAALDIAEDRKDCFCSFCGSKIFIDDGSRTFTHVHVDKTRELELALEAKRIEDERVKSAATARLKMISAISICVTTLFALITFVVIKNDFNITFNFCLMLIGSIIAIARIHKKDSTFGTIMLSVILDAACVAFMVMRDDFNTTFVISIALIITFHSVASIIKKNN